jgi:peptidoglycan hydrolase-like protein with peptidoglycan-binding domain
MKHKKRILTAVIVSGSIGLGAQSISAQAVPGGKAPEPNIPEKVQPPPAREGKQPGLGSEQQGMASAEDIRSGKEALKAKGHDPGPINGTMDSKTQQALRDFQKKENLPVTGTFDKETLEKLGVGAKKGSTPERGPGGSLPKQEPGGAAPKPEGKGTIK